MKNIKSFLLLTALFVITNLNAQFSSVNEMGKEFVKHLKNNNSEAFIKAFYTETSKSIFKSLMNKNESDSLLFSAVPENKVNQFIALFQEIMFIELMQKFKKEGIDLTKITYKSCETESEQQDWQNYFYENDSTLGKNVFAFIDYNNKPYAVKMGKAVGQNKNWYLNMMNGTPDFKVAASIEDYYKTDYSSYDSVVAYPEDSALMAVDTVAVMDSTSPYYYNPDDYKNIDYTGTIGTKKIVLTMYMYQDEIESASYYYIKSGESVSLNVFENGNNIMLVEVPYAGYMTLIKKGTSYTGKWYSAKGFFQYEVKLQKKK